MARKGNALYFRRIRNCTVGFPRQMVMNFDEIDSLTYQ
jgi:hypothetical protein